MKIIDYIYYRNSDGSYDHEKYQEYTKYHNSLDKNRKFKSTKDLREYLDSYFGEDEYYIEFYSNSPSFVFVAINNKLIKIELDAIKTMDKYLLDKLLFDNGLIKEQIYIEEKEINSKTNTVIFTNLGRVE